MRKTSVIRGFLSVLVFVWMATWASVASAISLSQFTGFNFNNPIGIDFHEPNGGNLIMSVNFSTGLPHNLDLVNISTAVPTQFSTLSGLTEELKIATARNSAACQQFPVGDVFTGNGQPGEIVRLDKNGTVYSPAANNPGVAGTVGGVPHFSWVKLPGSLPQDLLRGSLFVDRNCAFGGDLIVVTSDEETYPTNGGGAVWRVKSDGTATLLTRVVRAVGDNCSAGQTCGIHFEGVITLPNDPKYGPWAGTIIAGDENLNVDLTKKGRIWSITAAGVATAYDLSFTVGGTTFPVKPEDIDLIEPGGDFFGVNFGDSRILTALASNFASFTGDILVTQEFPCGSTSNAVTAGCGTTPTTGLYVVRYVGSGGNAAGGQFNTTLLTFSAGSPVTSVSQWEHVTIAPRGDVQVTKSTSDTTPINAGAVAHYSIVVQANGPATSFNVVLTDTVPTGVDASGWAVQVLPVADQGKCSPNPVLGGGTLTCNFGDMAPGDQKQITLTAKTTTAACPSIKNTAVVNSVNDSNSSNNSSGPVTITVNCPSTNLQTVTQGGWGAPPHGNNPGALLQKNFSTVYPGGSVSIGGGAGCFALKFTSSTAIMNFLPQGGTPGALAASATNPTTSAAGVFAGQVLALQLNVDFSNAGKLPSGLGSFVLTSGAAKGKTVAQVLADANKALGCGTLPSYVSSISDLNDIVDSINEMFDK